MAATGRLRVEIACAIPGRQIVLVLEVSAATTAAAAISTSGIQEHFPEIDMRTAPVGIFGRRVKPGALLADGDRVEIYRRLTADPKEARRRRAKRRTDSAGSNGSSR